MYCGGNVASAPSASAACQGQRVVEHAAGECHHVGLTRGDDGFGLAGVGDLANGHGGYPGIPAQGVRKTGLVAGACNDLLVRRIAAAGDIDKVAARSERAWA